MDSQTLIQSIVTSIFKDPQVQILDYSAEPAVPKGENYASKLSRIRIKVSLLSKEEKTVSVICKEYPDEEKFAEWIKSIGCFKKEILMYSKLFPLMEKLMDEEPNGDYPWAKSVYHFREELFVLEDLKTEGYETVNRHKGMDINQTMLVFEALAKFHACSWYLWNKGQLNPADFVYHFLLADPDLHEKFNKPTVKVLSDIILSEWGKEWEQIATRLKNLIPHVWEKICEINTPKEGAFNVLNHGDIWASNVMFKTQGGMPTSVKLLDCQVCHFNCYTFDIHHTLNMAVSIEVRAQHTDKLIQVYVDTLNQYLRKLNISPKGAPTTMADVKQDMRRTSFYGFLIAVTELCVAHIDTSLGFNYDTVIANQSVDNITMNTLMFKEKFYTEFLKLVLPSFYEQGAF